MKEKMILIIKGIIIGIANIIPGVSGGTLAITLGLYEKIIYCINHLFTELKKNIIFLLPIGIGAIIAILLGSRLIEYGFKNYPLATTLFFVGLVLGGVPFIYRKVNKSKITISNIIVFLLTFTLVLSLYFINSDGNSVNLTDMNVLEYLLLFLVGIISAATMVIPGISGSLLLMTIGYYNPIVSTISNLTKFENILDNIIILIPFGIGIVLGIILVAKLIEFLFKKYRIKTYYGILGFLISSILVIIIPLFELKITSVEFVVGIILLIMGFMVAEKLGEK